MKRSVQLLQFFAFRQISTQNSRFILNKQMQKHQSSTFQNEPTKEDDLKVNVTFLLPDGTRHSTKAKIGDTLLDVVINCNVPVDGFGACEGTLACSTCHVILKKFDYDRIPNKPLDEENDMLDLAYELCDTSRLGCQIVLTKDLDGLEVQIPAGTYDVRGR